MQAFLPVAHMDINLLLVMTLGGGVGLLSGLVGVGGGFLLTPILLMLGVPPIVAAGTSTGQIVGTSAAGSYSHYRLGNVDIRMALLLIVGGLTGGSVGVYIAKILEQGGHFHATLSFIYVIVLGFVGTTMLVESISALLPGKHNEPGPEKGPSLMGRLIASLPGQIDFPVSNMRLSFLAPLILGTAVGSITSLGISGGFLMVPALIYLMKVPTKVAVGTSLFQLLFIASNVTVLQAGMNHAVDPYLAVTLVLGSSLGSVLGARLGHKMKGEQLRLILAVVVAGVAVQMALGLLLTPSDPFILVRTK